MQPKPSFQDFSKPFKRSPRIHQKTHNALHRLSSLSLFANLFILILFDMELSEESLTEEAQSLGKSFVVFLIENLTLRSLVYVKQTSQRALSNMCVFILNGE